MYDMERLNGVLYSLASVTLLLKPPEHPEKIKSKSKRNAAILILPISDFLLISLCPPL
jgi:hypothetical protein